MDVSERQEIERYYTVPPPNEKLRINQEQVEVEIKSKKMTGEATIYLELMPSVKLIFDIKCAASDSTEFVMVLNEFEGKINFLAKGEIIKCFFLHKKFTPTKPFELVATPEKEPIFIETADQLDEIIFYLINFLDFRADPFWKTIGDKSIMCNRITLKADDWEIEIESLESIKDNIDLVKKRGGYAYTHIGRIKKANSKSFPTKKGYHILNALGTFLSFSKGIWISPVLAIGLYDKKKNWEQWGSGKISSWENPITWFDYRKGETLSDLFPGFYKIWDDDVWNKTIQEIISWYLLSTTGSSGIDGAIILTQAALERLSWLMNVQINRNISKDGFSKITAADQLRALLFNLGIPLNIPEHMEVLLDKAKEKEFDGPGILTNKELMFCEAKTSILYSLCRFHSEMYSYRNKGKWLGFYLSTYPASTLGSHHEPYMEL